MNTRHLMLCKSWKKYLRTQLLSEGHNLGHPSNSTGMSERCDNPLSPVSEKKKKKAHQLMTLRIFLLLLQGVAVGSEQELL